MKKSYKPYFQSVAKTTFSILLGLFFLSSNISAQPAPPPTNPVFTPPPNFTPPPTSPITPPPPTAVPTRTDCNNQGCNVNNVFQSCPGDPSGICSFNTNDPGCPYFCNNNVTPFPTPPGGGQQICYNYNFPPHNGVCRSDFTTCPTVGGVQLCCPSADMCLSPSPTDLPEGVVPSFDLCGATPDAGCVPCHESGGAWTALGCIPGDPVGLLSSLLRFAINIGGGIAFLIMLIGVLLIVLAGGNPEKMQAGRETITAAFFGLLTILFGATILQLVGIEIFDLPGLVDVLGGSASGGGGIGSR